jgi:hypothetical protein
MNDFESSSATDSTDNDSHLEPENGTKPPGKIGVYDRPEQRSTRSIIILFIALILLVLAAFLIFQFIF